MKTLAKRAAVMAGCLIALAWCVTVFMRLRHAEFEFVRARPAGTEEFFSSARPAPWQTVRPLLLNPLRKDVRLYFNHHPKINRHSCDAWASNETGEWTVKIHN